MGTIRIDGKVNGEIKVEGDIYIGKDSEIIGNVYTKNIFLSGKVQGNIEAQGLLNATSTAEIYGDILYKT